MIAGIHGIGYQRLKPEIEEPKWREALAVGLREAGVDVGAAQQLRFLYYGDLFLSAGRAAGDPPYDHTDVEDGFELELLQAWAEEAMRTDPGVRKPGVEERMPTVPRPVQWLLDKLSRSEAFAGISEAAMIADLKQVSQYMSNAAKRRAIQQRIAERFPEGTRLVIGHSLGSVVAYEALCAHPELKVEGLITIGSPLGIRNLIFDRLIPSPEDGLGAWPGSVGWWVNVAADGDVVALVKRLSECFGLRVRDWPVDNTIVNAHGAELYLRQAAVGAQVRRIL